MRGLLLFDLDDVIAVLRLTRPEVWPGCSEKAAWSNSGTVAPCLRKPSSPPCVLAAGIVGVCLRQLGEVAAMVELIENALRLGLGSGVGLGVVAVDLDEDVADLHLVVDLVVLEVLVVVLLNLQRR